MKLEFNIIYVEQYEELLKNFFLTENMFKEKSLSEYPELKNKLKNQENREKELIKFFKEYERIHKNELLNAKELAEKWWSEVGDELINSLEKIHELKITETHYALISLNPICPRFLKEKTFFLFYRFKKNKMIDSILHELSHFFFFKVFKSVFPQINSEEYEHPHLVWKLSEIIVELIFKDKSIQEIFSKEESSVYANIQNIVVEDKKLLDVLKNMYDERINFKDFVKKSYEFVKKHEIEINQQF